MQVKKSFKRTNKGQEISRKRRGFFSQYHFVRRRLPKLELTRYDALPKKRVLVLSPHPEEHVEKCYATIKGFLKSGSHVGVHVVTPGWHGVKPSSEQLKAVRKKPVGERGRALAAAAIKTRRAETREADKSLGVRSVFHNFDFYSTGVVSRADLSRMREIISKEKPEVVIMPSPMDLQPAHAAVYDLALKYLKRAARSSGKRIEVWGFETPYNQHSLAELNQVVSYTESLQTEKMNAMAKHVSQESRRKAVLTDRMAEATRAMAVKEELMGFGSKVSPMTTEHMELFSKSVLVPFGPLVFSKMKR